MIEHALPDPQTLYRALVEKDAAFDGLFFAGVTTTGIFCRPVCTARKPKRDHVVFYPSARDALLAGYRPCKVCRPMAPPDETPEAVRVLLADLAADPSLRLRDADLRARGIEPAGLRRWFKRHHGMTFQGYQRALRLGVAFGQMKHGESATAAALDTGWESLSGFGEAFKALTGAAPTRVRGTVITVARIETPLGPMLGGAAEEGLCLLEFVDRRMIETQLARLKKLFKAALVPGQSPHLDRLAGELLRYFDGTLSEFTVPLDLRGTPFQTRVWNALRTIPYGSTRSYGEQARRIGEPAAVRAVARANGDNRIAIIVPCHRVVGADGALTGYGGGVWRKRWLLDHERGHAATGGGGD
jgi:AraC family transcriptional regulator of adaptative response/methylated-DNA-[protein]-cysteine methyltransferase